MVKSYSVPDEAAKSILALYPFLMSQLVAVPLAASKLIKAYLLLAGDSHFVVAVLTEPLPGTVSKTNT